MSVVMSSRPGVAPFRPGMCGWLRGQCCATVSGGCGKSATTATLARKSSSRHPARAPRARAGAARLHELRVEAGLLLGLPQRGVHIIPVLRLSLAAWERHLSCEAVRICQSDAVCSQKKSQRSLQRLKWHALLLSMHMQGLKPRTAFQRRRGSPPGRGRALVRAQVRCPLCQDDSDGALCVLHHMPRPRCSAVWCGDAAPQGKDAPRKGRQAPPHDAQRPATVRQAQRHPQTLHKLSRAGACWPSHWSSAFLWEGTEALHDHIQSLRWRRAPRCNHCSSVRLPTSYTLLRQYCGEGSS